MFYNMALHYFLMLQAEERQSEVCFGEEHFFGDICRSMADVDLTIRIFFRDKSLLFACRKLYLQYPHVSRKNSHWLRLWVSWVLNLSERCSAEIVQNCSSMYIGNCVSNMLRLHYIMTGICDSNMLRLYYIITWIGHDRLFAFFVTWYIINPFSSLTETEWHFIQKYDSFSNGFRKDHHRPYNNCSCMYIWKYLTRKAETVSGLRLYKWLKYSTSLIKPLTYIFS